MQLLKFFVFGKKHLSSIEKGRNGHFAAEGSRGTKVPNWRANDALGHVEQKFNYGGFV